MAVATAAVVGLTGLVMQGIGMWHQAQAAEAQKEIVSVQEAATQAGITAQIENVQEASEFQVERTKEAGEANIGAAKAAYGASGVSVTEGSPLAELAGRRENLETDISYIQDSAAREVEALRTQSGYVTEGAEFQRQGIDSQKDANTFLGIGQMASSAFSLYTGGVNAGLWGVE